MRKSGSTLRPRCPSVSFCTRRRTWSSIRLATLVTWKGSATRLAWERWGCSPAAIGVGQVEGDHLDPLEPALGSPGAPFAQLGGTFALEQVDHDAPVQIDQGGGVDGRVRAIGREIGVLVDAEGPHRSHPRGPSCTNGVPCNSTADQAVSQPTPYSLGHRGHRAAELADLAGDLGAGPDGSAPGVRRCRRSSRSRSSSRTRRSGSASGFLLITRRHGRPKQCRSRRWTSIRSWAWPVSDTTGTPLARVSTRGRPPRRARLGPRAPPARQSQHLLCQSDTVTPCQGPPRACRLR
jgi:hypothetical protein